MNKDASYYISGINNKDLSILSKAITICESTKLEHKFLANSILEKLKFDLSTIRIGISGPPGVGKSTFIEELGNVISQEHNLAVLAIDPTSEISGGSILGDKTRMEQLAKNDRVYIRPSSNSGTLGGVASNTQSTIFLCENTGFDVTIVETVGVGQSETIVKEMVDMFVLLIPPAGGDELQGIKKGIVEIADIIIINKADGSLKEQAQITKQEYKSALHYTQKQIKVIANSSLDRGSVENTWREIKAYFEQQDKYFIDKNRKIQFENYKQSIANDLLFNLISENEKLQALIKNYKRNEVSYEELYNKFKERINF